MSLGGNGVARKSHAIGERKENEIGEGGSVTLTFDESRRDEGWLVKGTQVASGFFVER